MSMEELGEKLNLTHQQVHKYEKGSSSITVGRLLEICEVLHVPLSFMFEGAAVSLESLQPRKQQVPSFMNEALATRQGLQLVEAFQRIEDPELRRRIATLVAAVADRRS